MEKIVNKKDVKRGGSVNFTYKGQKAVLVKNQKDELFAYIAVCPHEQGIVEWDKDIKKLVCECHLSLFNVGDGTIYRHSTIFKHIDNLTPIKLVVDDQQDIYAD